MSEQPPAQLTPDELKAVTMQVQELLGAHSLRTVRIVSLTLAARYVALTLAYEADPAQVDVILEGTLRNFLDTIEQNIVAAQSQNRTLQ